MSAVRAAVRVAVLATMVCPLLVACATPSLASLTSSEHANLTVDGTQRFQRIDGFGVNVNSLPWDGGTLTPALSQLADELGASVWRVIVESKSGWEDTPNAGNATTYNWTYYDQLYETPKFQALWGALGYLQQKHIPTIMLNVMGCAPVWMGGCAINPADEDYYVTMETSLLYYARNVKHLRIDLFSPMNEEDHGDPEGPLVNSTQYVRILEKLSARLDALGLGDIRLLGPDTASIGAAASDYMPALLAAPQVMAKIEHFGLHDYGGNAGNAAKVIGDSAYPNRNFWMTEYSAWCDGCDNGAPNPDDWAFATGTSDYLFNFIQQGASSALVYDGYDSYYLHHGSMGYWGLLSYDATSKAYSPRKRFYTVAQVVKFVRPGMVRIGTVSSDESLRVFAFTDPKTGALTIVGRNVNSGAKTLHGTLANMPTSATLALFQTTQALNMERGADVAVRDGAFTAQIAPDSVFTLTNSPDVGSSAHQATSTPVYTATPTDVARATVVGNFSVGATIDTGDSNYLNGSRFTTTPIAGAVTSMSVHVGKVSPAPQNQYQLAIYTDRGGSPGGLIAHTGTGTLTPNAWNSLPINATLSPNTAYWLMYNTNGTGDEFNNMNFEPANPVPEAYSASSVPYGTWPSSAGGAILGTGAFSIYASYALPAHASTSSTSTAAPTGTVWSLALLLIGILVAAGALFGVMMVTYRRRGHSA
jgi:O-glycosyl hydrolase